MGVWPGPGVLKGGVARGSRWECGQGLGSEKGCGQGPRF